MSGETEQQVSGWTVDTLKEYHDNRIRGVEEMVELRAAAVRVAQDKFEATVERDAVKQNEFRGALSDLSKEMATRRELEDVATQLADLRSRLDVGPTGLATLQARADYAGGRQAANQVTVTHFFAGLGALIAVVGLLYAVTRKAPTVVVPTPTVTVTNPS